MKTDPELNGEKFIVFTVADYRFALPIDEVVQIVKRPATTPELSKAGLIQLGRQVIRLLDLHQQLEPENGANYSEDCSFLVITHRLAEGFCAIPVSEPPNLVEFPQASMQSLPPTRDRSGVLRIASHAATLDVDRVPATIFLIDMQRMLDARSEVLDRAMPMAHAIDDFGYNPAKEARE